MRTSDRKYALKWNSIMWLTAMGMPAICHIALASTKFPWPVVFPLLLFGPMLFSNRLISQAAEETKDEQKPN